MDKSRNLKLDVVAQACDSQHQGLRQEDCCEFEACLCYKVSFCLNSFQKKQAKLTANKLRIKANNNKEKNRKKQNRAWWCVQQSQPWEVEAGGLGI